MLESHQKISAAVSQKVLQSKQFPIKRHQVVNLFFMLAKTEQWAKTSWMSRTTTDKRRMTRVPKAFNMKGEHRLINIVSAMLMGASLGRKWRYCLQQHHHHRHQVYDSNRSWSNWTYLTLTQMQRPFIDFIWFYLFRFRSLKTKQNTKETPLTLTIIQ